MFNGGAKGTLLSSRADRAAPPYRGTLLEMVSRNRNFMPGDDRRLDIEVKKVASRLIRLPHSIKGDRSRRIARYFRLRYIRAAKGSLGGAVNGSRSKVTGVPRIRYLN